MVVLEPLSFSYLLLKGSGLCVGFLEESTSA